MNTEPQESRPEKLSSMQTDNFDALVLLLSVLHRISDVSVTDYEEFRREALISWALGRAWELPSALLGGHIELNLRRDVLGVRIFRAPPHGKRTRLVQLRILLKDTTGLHCTSVRRRNDAHAKLALALILEGLLDNATLRPLERSISRATQRYLPQEDLLRSFDLVDEDEDLPS